MRASRAPAERLNCRSVESENLHPESCLRNPLYIISVSWGIFRPEQAEKRSVEEPHNYRAYPLFSSLEHPEQPSHAQGVVPQLPCRRGTRPRFHLVRERHNRMRRFRAFNNLAAYRAARRPCSPRRGRGLASLQTRLQICRDDDILPSSRGIAVGSRAHRFMIYA